MNRLIIIILLISAATSASADRTITTLNDNWEFLRGPFSDDLHKDANRWNGAWQQVSLPHTWNAEDMQRKANAFYEGKGYYRTRLHLKPDNKRHYLRFEGVGACAEVYVNGKLTASHKGAYSAFTAEITNVLKDDGENEILIVADNASRPDVIPVNHQLFGVYGGIYRPVSLISTDKVNITPADHAGPGIYISQSSVSPASAKINIRTKLDNGGQSPAAITVVTEIADAAGKSIAGSTDPITLSPQGIQSFEKEFTIRHPHLWQGIEDPYLYRVTTTLMRGDSIVDQVIQPLGIRSFEARAGEGFFLNGKRYPMRGVTRHQDREGIGSALTNKEHDEDLAMMMDIGATTVRLAHYQQADYIYSRCDSLGLVVWAEIPFVNRVTGKEWENAHQQLLELIRQNYNHPSIYVWGLHNEVYNPTDYTARLTASLHDLAKTEDPGRITASVNGYGIAMHPVNNQADIQGMNRYFGWYEGEIPDIDDWINNLEKDFPWQRLILSEYGADGNPDHQTELLEESLNWTKPYYPETFQTKTHEYHWSVIDRHPHIIASYLWNLFDFACPMWSRGGVEARNLKGLVSFDRKNKKDSYYWYKANWSKDPVVYITQRRNTERERRNTSITVYCNRGMPSALLNGKPLPQPRQGYTPVHWIFDNITLSDGLNIITASTPDKQYSDTIKWEYSGESDRSPSHYVNRSTHSGF